ncbi:hypothetical protein HMPREF3208_00025 [Gardnerella vaginalis]|uniref:Uncharacterized protein n=1 Tax=Gardnerella vaginalis TaxID=2702 RepID=A0A133P3F9_GARVA|nr:hypothetical protein HMPREF3208_00025 [Gardnerella vaginalis]
MQKLVLSRLLRNKKIVNKLLKTATYSLCALMCNIATVRNVQVVLSAANSVTHNVNLELSFTQK